MPEWDLRGIRFYVGINSERVSFMQVCEIEHSCRKAANRHCCQAEFVRPCGKTADRCQFHGAHRVITPSIPQQSTGHRIKSGSDLRLRVEHARGGRWTISGGICEIGTAADGGSSPTVFSPSAPSWTVTDHSDHTDEIRPPPSPGRTCSMTSGRSASGKTLAIVVPLA